MAVRNRDYDIARLLIEKGADVKKKEMVRLKHNLYMLYIVKSVK